MQGGATFLRQSDAIVRSENCVIYELIETPTEPLPLVVTHAPSKMAAPPSQSARKIRLIVSSPQSVSRLRYWP